MITTALRAAGLSAILLVTACGQSEDKSGDTASTPAAPAPAATPEQKAAWMTPRGDILGDIELGNPDAKITVIEYASLTCPHCKKFGEETLEPFKKDYLETGKAKYVFRHYVMNPYDLYASMIARCGGVSRYYGLMDLFFAKQSYWADADYQVKLQGLAGRAGLAKGEIEACLKNPALQQALLDSTATGQKEWDITGTPTIIVNGEKQPQGEILYPEFRKILDAAS